jgi:hypothetical protein
MSKYPAPSGRNSATIVKNARTSSGVQSRCVIPVAERCLRKRVRLKAETASILGSMSTNGPPWETRIMPTRRLSPALRHARSRSCSPCLCTRSAVGSCTASNWSLIRG